MTTDVPVHCRCGKLRGVVLEASAENGNHVICYCRDCQAFARFLGTDGILDANNGSDIYQIAPSRLRIESGHDQIACVRLSPKGLMRWYAACCRTPIGNGMSSSRVPFIGLVQPFMDHGASGPEGSARTATLGPVILYSRPDSASGALPLGAPVEMTVRLVARFVRFMGGGVLRGRSRPTPFFADDGRPVVEPEVLAAEVHEALQEGRKAAVRHPNATGAL